ncbi:MAG: amino acid adenylation domain-containing protein, partial [Thermoanaerobaculia bacterium]|nr:amino acid adenylation domain-containing protein [Thermoanaerobaculia bacterium]
MTDIAPSAPRLTREQLAGLIRQRTRRIGPRDRSLGPARLSAAQERLWFFEQVEPGGFTYNMPAAALLTGDLDTAALVAALGAVLARHEGLRSLIHWDGAKPVQLVMPTPVFDLPVVDLRHLPAAAREREIGRRLAQEAQRGFDLGRELPVRGLLLPIAADEHVLAVTFHHIACDAWSVGVFLRDLALEYAHRTSGVVAAPAPLEIQYGDFAAWQRSDEFEKEVAGHLPFWRQHLAGAPAALELPLDSPRPARQGFHGTFFVRRLTAEQVEQASVFARGQRATLFNVLMGVFRGVLARLCGVDDLVVGTAVAGRTRREIEDLVGLFINTLPLRLQVGDDPTFLDLLSRERDLALEALSHQEVPFERIVQELAVGRDNSRAPILQVLLQVQNTPAGRLELPGITLRRLELENPQSKLDLVVSAEAEDDGHYRVIWRWATALFEHATIARLADRFEAALTAVLAEPELRLSSWPLLLPAEAEQLRSWNQTAVDYDAAGATLVSLFEAQVDRTPEAVAVVMDGVGTSNPRPGEGEEEGVIEESADTEVGRDSVKSVVAVRGEAAVGAAPRGRPSWAGGGSPSPGRGFEGGGERGPGGEVCLTYAQLDARANQLAHHLRRLGVGPEVKVGIAAERSLDLVVGLYGILKAGGAYVPIDPSYPEDRIAYMIGDAAVPVLLTQSHLTLPEHEAQVVLLDDPSLAAEPTTRPEPWATAEHLAYTIYTSGSTGRPKGAKNAHRGIVNRLLWMQAEYGLDASDRVLQKTPFSFDVSVWEFFWPLLVGAQLVVAKPEGHKDPAYLVETIARHGITTLHFVPSMLQVFVEASGVERCTSLRRVMASGEALPADLVKRHYERLPDTPLHNLYGPTEAAVDVTYWPTSADDRAIPIGYPVANTRIHILDARLHEAPMSVAGELLIGGIQVGRGYHGRPALTAEKFIPDPFATEPGARLYRTGDLARWVSPPDTPAAVGADQRVRPLRGHVEYLGRIDFQVKIRGFRIELGEIESALAAQPGVREAVVTVRTVGGGPALVAYLTATVETPDTAALRAALLARLPEYMVPAHFLVLPEMPLNPSGKVDRKQLPAPEVRAGSAERVAPRTPLEAHLVGLFSSRLGGAELGVHDDFFALGGNSIGGALLVNQLQDELGEIVHVVTLFEAATPARLAEFLEREYPAAVARLTGGAVASFRAEVAEGIAERDVIAVQASIEPLAPWPGLATARRNQRALFVLGPPRSGTTLLRVMLAGHPALFAPPELELLGFNTLAERRAAFPGPDAFRLEGLTRAVMELRGHGAAEAGQVLATLEEEGLSVHELYGLLEGWLGERLLVDKTPTYAWDPATLARAEQSFADARYLHLIRHPYGTIRSFEEARIDQIFYRREHGYSRRQLAEILWLLAHRNVLRFLATVPAERRYTVHFEDLVRQPERTLRGITEFLGLEFEPAMATPYGDSAEQRSRRMTDGVVAESRMIGDVKFHQQRQVDARAADEWRAHYRHDFLSAPTWDLAAELGYDPVSERVGASWALAASEPARPGEEDVLSFQEERLWFLDQLEPGTALYNLAAALELRGELDPAALEAAVGDLVARQGSLATAFPAAGGRPRRVVHGTTAAALPLVDLSALPESERRRAADDRAGEFARAGFDLATGPLFRTLLLRLAPDHHVLAVCLHHAIADGWSLRVLITELGELYRARRAEEPARLAPLAVTYADYSRWQRRWLAGAELERQLAFWRGELAGAPTVLELPADRSRPAERSVRGATAPVRHGQALGRQLTALATRGGATEFMVFLAGLATLLGRSTGVSELLLGAAVANRGRREVESLVGFFVNTLVLRVDLGGDPTFVELLARVRRATLGAYAHGELPFEKLVEELQPERSLSHAPLVQVLVSYQNAAPLELTLPGLTVEPVDLGQDTAKFDLTFQVNETPRGLAGWIEYSTDLFDRTTVDRLAERLARLVAAAAVNPELRLSQLDWLSPVERQQLLEWNATESAVPAATVHGLFEAQARRTPDAVAVTSPPGPLSPPPSNPRPGEGEEEGVIEESADTEVSRDSVKSVVEVAVGAAPR